MNLIPILFLLTLQDPQVKTIKVFPGGTFEQYEKFVATSRIFQSGLSVFPEKVFNGMGPVRRVEYTDGKIILDPPLTPFLKFEPKDQYPFLRPTIFPDPYCRAALSKPQEGDDIVVYLDPTGINGAAPGIKGSFKLGNGLKPFGFDLTIHPFFKDMWVAVSITGSWNPKILDSIAGCVGGIVKKQGTGSVKYKIEPNVEELRQRALSTLEYFSPVNYNNPARLREELRYSFIKKAPSDFIARWINAAGQRDRYALTDPTWTKPIYEYRDQFLTEKFKQQGSGTKDKYSLVEYQSMHMYIELGDYFSFGIVMIAPDGSEIWI
jgi:hypothetical protein